MPDREIIYQDWLRGQHRTIVGTNAIGAGVDLPRVRVVLHVGAPASAMAYSQEAGRARRDGRAAVCLNLLSHVLQPDDAHTETVNANRTAMREFLSTKSCRRQLMTTSLDGGNGVDCKASSAHQSCDEYATVPVIFPPTSINAGDISAGDHLARGTTRQQEMDRRGYLDCGGKQANASFSLVTDPRKTGDTLSVPPIGRLGSSEPEASVIRRPAEQISGGQNPQASR